MQLVSTSAEATDYIAEWVTGAAKPGSSRWTGSRRLAANAEKKTKLDMSEAIADWKQDQAWLRKTTSSGYITATEQRRGSQCCESTTRLARLWSRGAPGAALLLPAGLRGVDESPHPNRGIAPTPDRSRRWTDQ